MKAIYLSVLLCASLGPTAALGHPGGHGEIIAMDPSATATNGARIAWALVLFGAALGSLLLALAKTRGLWQRAVLGGAAALLVLYACSGGDSSPTQSQPETPSQSEPGADAPPPPPDPATSAADTEAGTGDADMDAGDAATSDDDAAPSDDDASAAPSGDALANDPAAMTATFAPHARVGTRFDDTYFYVESDGLPDHQMMVNITTWIAQVPLPHPYTGDNAWSIPLRPRYAENPISIETDFQRGAIAIAANGIPIFNPLNASGLVSKDIGELDDFGGHAGRADDYHYHAAPLHLESAADLPIAYGFDGFPVYGSREPDGSPMQALDAYHGHEMADGSYHYHGTDTYPFLIGAMRGEVSLDPNTAAPQTQIIPQARSIAMRDPPHAINSDDLRITGLTANAAGNGYLLAYVSGGGNGSVEYSWSDDEVFTFVFNDVDGSTTTEVFERGSVAPPADAPDAPPDQTDAAAQPAGDTPTADGFVLTSAAVADGLLLADFKCERKSPAGIEDSIPLAWSGVPAGTGSLAVIMHHFPRPDDTDPAKANYYLILWGIDPSVSEIPRGGADDGAWFMGPNKDGDAISYTSPCSPSAGTHEYTVTLYALSATPASLPQESTLDVTYDVLLAAMETVTIIAKAELIFDDVTE